jgi:hypothetical protein
MLPRQREHEADPWGGSGVFQLRNSPQDDKQLFGDAWCLTTSQSWDQTFEVNCTQLEMIVSGTPKRDIQENINARAHAAVEISDKGTASIHLDVRSMTVKT